MSNEEAPKSVLVSQDDRDCGCQVNHYSDKKQMVAPCLGHALEQAAKSQVDTANFLNIASQRWFEIQANARQAGAAMRVQREVQAKKGGKR